MEASDGEGEEEVLPPSKVRNMCAVSVFTDTQLVSFGFVLVKVCF